MMKNKRNLAILSGAMLLGMVAIQSRAAVPLSSYFNGGSVDVTDGVVDPFYDGYFEVIFPGPIIVKDINTPLLKPGVAVGANGPAFSEDDGEGGLFISVDPLAQANVVTTEFHPSGYNMRRGVVALDPTGTGTLFIAFDLAGGAGILGPDNFQDGLVQRLPNGTLLSPPFTGAAIRPFDADGNGDPIGIGSRGAVRIPTYADWQANGGILDVLRPSNDLNDPLRNLTDTENSGEAFYRARVTFGGSSKQILVEMKTGLGNAIVGVATVENTAENISDDVDFSIIGGVAQGYDVVMAIRNFEQHVNCADLTDQAGNRTITVAYNPGSSVDGGGQGEPGQQVTVSYVPTDCTPTGDTVCAGVGSDATLSVQATGIGPFNYAWFKVAGNVPVGGNSPTLLIEDADLADAGQYRVDITDPLNCVKQCFATLQVIQKPTCEITGPTNPCRNAPRVRYNLDITENGNENVQVLWYLEDNTNGATFNGTPDATGAYVDVGPVVGGTPAASFTLRVRVIADPDYPECYSECTKTVIPQPCDPKIKITKEVLCKGEGSCPATGYKHSEKGVQTLDADGNAVCPVFCYKIEIENTGDLPLFDVVVTDSKFAALLALDPFLPNLAVGAKQTRYFSTPVCDTSDEVGYDCADEAGDGVETVIGELVNKAEVVGKATITGGTTATVTAKACARVKVDPIGVRCEKYVSIDEGLTWGTEAVLPSGTHTVWYQVKVYNTGTLPIMATVTDMNENCTEAPVTKEVPAVPDVPVIFDTICAIDITCPTDDYINQVKVEAVVKQPAQGDPYCDIGPDGEQIKAVAYCEATVKCRETGGCTPGFWKNCTAHWAATDRDSETEGLQPFYTGFDPAHPATTLGEVFDFGCSDLDACDLEGKTWIEALSFKGGSGICGATRNLLRAAAAACLNAASEEVEYFWTFDEVVEAVNTALGSCDRNATLKLAGELDFENNRGCHDASGNGLPCKIVR